MMSRSVFTTLAPVIPLGSALFARWGRRPPEQGNAPRRPPGGGPAQFFEQVLLPQIVPMINESPGTAHEWHTWRRSLHRFAALLFKN